MEIGQKVEKGVNTERTRLFEDSDRSPSIVFNNENRTIPEDHKHVYDRSDTKLNVSENVSRNNWRYTFCRGKLVIKTVEIEKTCFSSI
jgi:hypothetical protein